MIWTDAFKDCNEDKIVATTNVNIGNQRIAQIAGAKETNAGSNPCLRHEVKVTLTMNGLNGYGADIVWILI